MVQNWWTRFGSTRFMVNLIWTRIGSISKQIYMCFGHGNAGPFLSCIKENKELACYCHEERSCMCLIKSTSTPAMGCTGEDQIQYQVLSRQKWSRSAYIFGFWLVSIFCTNQLASIRIACYVLYSCITPACISLIKSKASLALN